MQSRKAFQSAKEDDKMDWTKAKSILIAALIVTNLVLILTYAFKDDLFENSEEQVWNETIQLLESKNIYIRTDKPEKHSAMPTLLVEYDSGNPELVDEQLAAQIPVKEKLSSDKLKEMTTDFIINCGLMTDTVTFDSIVKNGDEYTVTYKNYFNNIAIEESDMIFTVKNGKIENFERYWLNPVETGPTKKAIISAAAALLKFMNESGGDEKIKVENISLVYWLDPCGFDTESPISDTALPAWKITYNHGKIEYIWAYEQ